MSESLFHKTAAFQPATLSKTKLLCSGEYSKKATFPAMINEKKQLPQSLLTRN